MAERLLVSDWPEFERAWSRSGFTERAPKPAEAIVTVEWKEQRIVAFGVVRVYTVLETVWIDPVVRGKGLLTKLCLGVLDQLPRLSTLFAFTQDDRLVELYKHFGMEHCSNWRILRWVRH